MSGRASVLKKSMPHKKGWVLLMVPKKVMVYNWYRTNLEPKTSTKVSFIFFFKKFLEVVSETALRKVSWLFQDKGVLFYGIYVHYHSILLFLYNVT